MADATFTKEFYGESMPKFQLRGQEGLELFEGAVNNPRHSYHRTIHEKAAALFRSLIKNHPLVDGNKRIAVMALDVFLIVNRVDFKVGQGDMVDVALALAEYEGNFPLDWLVKWIRLGCLGRPKKLVAVIAEGWPDSRARLMHEARTQDLREGLGPRVPGRRVRLSPRFWAALREIERARPEQLRLGLNGR
jgi:death-on-curing family protein